MTEESKKEFVKRHLYSDNSAVELLWVIFYAVIRGIKKSSLLNPSPNPELLENILDGEISLLHADTIENVGKKHIELLYWLLNNNNFHIRSCAKNKFEDIKHLIGNVSEATASPNFIFEVIHNEIRDANFQRRRNDRQLLYAYHGTKVENFYSILHHGLLSHLSKNALFGEGIYLSSELSVSLLYAPQCLTWSNSRLGRTVSCVAVCEIIDDPLAVVCQTKERSAQRRRLLIRGSLGGEVPEKYYVVTNNELIRVKYLLIYSTFVDPQARWLGWFRLHCWSVILITYIVFLVILSLCKSITVQRFLFKLYSKLSQNSVNEL